MQIKFPVQDNKGEFSLYALVWKQKERALIALALVIIGAFFLVKGITAKEKLLGDFFQAGNFQSRISASSQLDELELLRLLKRHPELKPVFSHYLEQSYVLGGNIQLAKNQAEDSLKRLAFINPLYQEYAKASLLMEEGKFEEALAKSTSIADRLVKESSPNLYGLNLVRITFLNELLGKVAKSSKKWEEIQNLISNELFTHFSDESLSLIDFASKI